MKAQLLSIEAFLKQSEGQLLIDVRAPIEFINGHMAGAINIPLFEDIERAEIGTLYKQQGKDTAVTRGLEIVSPKMMTFVNEVKALSKNGKVFVYCFRGGMRSESFSWLMSTAGLETYYLKGGYKSFRNESSRFFEEKKKIILIGGKTGSGKTEILKSLNSSGLQTVDLEYIAHHKGSAFGNINEADQNPQQLFDAELFAAFKHLNPNEITILEDESQTIGFNKIPQGLWNQMLKATIIHIEVPLELRVIKLVKDYTTVDIAALKTSVLKISKRLGPLNTKLCLENLETGNLNEVARLALYYYDKTYSYKYDNPQQPIINIETDTIDENINAIKVKQVIDTLIS